MAPADYGVQHRFCASLFCLGLFSGRGQEAAKILSGIYEGRGRANGLDGRPAVHRSDVPHYSLAAKHDAGVAQILILILLTFM
ncbi:hypothetical protein D3C71_1943290 [compost metagenome]